MLFSWNSTTDRPSKTLLHFWWVHMFCEQQSISSLAITAKDYCPLDHLGTRGNSPEGMVPHRTTTFFLDALLCICAVHGFANPSSSLGQSVIVTFSVVCFLCIFCAYTCKWCTSTNSQWNLDSSHSPDYPLLLSSMACYGARSLKPTLCFGTVSIPQWLNLKMFTKWNSKTTLHFRGG